MVMVPGSYQPGLGCPGDGKLRGRYAAYPPFKMGNCLFIPAVLHAARGNFSVDPVEPSLVRRFIDSIPAKFRLVQLHLNCDNSINTADIPFRKRLTYVLDLNRPYEEIARGYSDDNHKNLRKAHRKNISVTRDLSIDQLIAFYRETYGDMNPGITDAHYNRAETGPNRRPNLWRYRALGRER